ncbi:hypothetical protein B0T17DRAFT_484612 [Bombardia bombarda]|uniref:Malate dehydrogenase n=1 Tax=Bombardia bombarda TaxID=252184 RepID=A0AA39XL04_9PEZI|nr:hypothetical protein B0T17DRAFT_484612 [Bombardia bombarda]
MVSAKSFLLAALAAGTYASPCKSLTPTLPGTGTTSLPAPAPTELFRRIAIGHGIQNYSCESSTSTPVQLGALAALYDVTPLYPGTPRTGLSKAAFDALPITTLYGQSIPLNLVDPTVNYNAVVGNPWVAPADLVLGGLPTIKFLGHHFFEIDNTPMFDLTAAGLKASVARNDSAAAPATADKGILGTGAVPWLQLTESNKNRSNGLNLVYRVVTAGGVAQSCLTTGAGVGSVPYTTFYWFYAA